MAFSTDASRLPAAAATRPPFSRSIAANTRRCRQHMPVNPYAELRTPRHPVCRRSVRDRPPLSTLSGSHTYKRTNVPRARVRSEQGFTPTARLQARAAQWLWSSRCCITPPSALHRSEVVTCRNDQLTKRASTKYYGPRDAGRKNASPFHLLRSLCVLVLSIVCSSRVGPPGDDRLCLSFFVSYARSSVAHAREAKRPPDGPDGSGQRIDAAAAAVRACWSPRPPASSSFSHFPATAQQLLPPHSPFTHFQVHHEGLRFRCCCSHRRHC